MAAVISLPMLRDSTRSALSRGAWNPGFRHLATLIAFGSLAPAHFSSFVRTHLADRTASSPAFLALSEPSIENLKRLQHKSCNRKLVFSCSFPPVQRTQINNRSRPFSVFLTCLLRSNRSKKKSARRQRPQKFVASGAPPRTLLGNLLKLRAPGPGPRGPLLIQHCWCNNAVRSRASIFVPATSASS